MGSNLSNFFRNMYVFFSGIIVAFLRSRKLILIAVAMIPSIAVVFTALALVIQLNVKVELQAYNVAAEIFGSVHNVFAFGEKNAVERYDKELASDLETAQTAGVREGIHLGKYVPT